MSGVHVFAIDVEDTSILLNPFVELLEDYSKGNSDIQKVYNLLNVFVSSLYLGIF